MVEKVIIFGEEVEVRICTACNGSGNLQDWDRKQLKFVEDKNYPCESCRGSKYLIVSSWKRLQ